MFELKIPKGYSEAMNRRRTDNTMIKRKRTKGQTTFYKTLHRKLTTEKHGPHQKEDDYSILWEKIMLPNLIENNILT
jgi:hypothetical protein